MFIEHHDKLNDMIQQLTLSLAGVKHEQEYMEVRDRVHRASMFSFSFYMMPGGNKSLKSQGKSLNVFMPRTVYILKLLYI